MSTPATWVDIGAYAIGEELLRRINSLAAGRGITLPGRQVILPGGATIDCEQVTVVLGDWTPVGQETGNIGGGGVCPRIWMVGVNVGISRATPAVHTRMGRGAPGEQQLNEAGLLASNDADILVDLGDTLGIVGGEMQVLLSAPEGGYQTTSLSVSISRVGGLG